MQTAAGVRRDTLMTRVIPANTGGGTITYAVLVRLGFNWREYVITGPYDPRTLQPEQSTKPIPRTVVLSDNVPVIVMIGGVGYDVVPPLEPMRLP